MWNQAINTTVPQYTTWHIIIIIIIIVIIIIIIIMEYCIYIYIATFTEINLSQLHGTPATFGTSDLLKLSPTSPVGQSPQPLEDESLIDGIVYDGRSTKASPWGNVGKGCAMVECLATWQIHGKFYNLYQVVYSIHPTYRA